MKAKLSTEFTVNAALTLSAFFVGIAITGALFFPHLHEPEIADTVFDVGAVLDTTNAATTEGGGFLPPVDHREADYIALRQSAKTLSDGDVLTLYRDAWEDLKVFKETTGGHALPQWTAEDKAMPMHALWREIQQRGLAPRSLAPEFRSVWTYMRESS